MVKEGRKEKGDGEGGRQQEKGGGGKWKGRG